MPESPSALDRPPLPSSWPAPRPWIATTVPRALRSVVGYPAFYRHCGRCGIGFTGRGVRADEDAAYDFELLHSVCGDAAGQAIVAELVRRAVIHIESLRV